VQRRIVQKAEREYLSTGPGSEELQTVDMGNNRKTAKEGQSSVRPRAGWSSGGTSGGEAAVSQSLPAGLQRLIRGVKIDPSSYEAGLKPLNKTTFIEDALPLLAHFL